MLTVVSTLLALLLIGGVWKGITLCFAPYRGVSGGWELVLRESGSREIGRMVGRPWQRQSRLSRSIQELWRRCFAKEDGDVEERRRLLNVS